MIEQTKEVTRGEAIHEGKAKVIYATSDPDLLIQYFKDDATAFNGEKSGTIKNKGVVNNAISTHIFKLLEKAGVKTHYVATPTEREMLIKRVDIIPVEVVMRNIAAGSLAKRMGVEKGLKLSEPVLEYYYKDDDLGDPMINTHHIRAFKLADDEDMDFIARDAFKVNEWMVNYFDNIGITLVDFKLEYGKCSEGILLADEISPDGCRFWDKKDGRVLDKDRFRRDMGQLEETYEEMRQRVLASGDPE